jgi:hypothetical protein
MSNMIQMRKELVSWMSSFDNKYSLTITFRNGTSNKATQDGFNKLIHLLNQRIFGRRYKKKDLFITGIVARECQLNGTLHYHAILRENGTKLPNKNDFDKILEECILKIKSQPKYSSSSIYDDNQNVVTEQKMRLVANDGYDLQEYYNNQDNKLEKYITKNFELSKLTITEAINSYDLITKDSITFGQEANTHPLLHELPKYTAMAK